MIIFTVMKWKFLNVILICSSIVVCKGKHIQHGNENEDVSENSSNLYFNGGEEETSDNKFQITEKDLPKDGELFEGDMIMDSALRRAVLGEEAKKAAIFDSELDGKKHWPRGIIPYVVHDSLPQKVRDQIPKAIKIFKYFTCVKFVPKTKEVDYVIFKNGKGCSSSVGQQGGSQVIHLAKGCKRIGTVMHEMMHTLGIIHEQSRPDRDLYLYVKFKNIKKSLLRNFMKYEFNQADTLNTPYNYYSVMHYSNYAFSKNDEQTLVSKFDEGLEFGQRKMLSHLDVKQINTLYPCHKLFKRKDLLHDDMTAKIILKKRRDARKDEWRDAWKDMIDEYF